MKRDPDGAPPSESLPLPVPRNAAARPSNVSRSGLAALFMAMSLTLLGGAQALVAQAAPPSLESLAAAWSAGHSRPTCTPSAQGDPVARALGTEQCTWPRIKYAGGSAQVTGTQHRSVGLTLISWELRVATHASALALRDSLSLAFRHLGLKEYNCRNEGRRWQQRGLGVELHIGVVHPDGLLWMGVAATPLTEAIPAVMCPDAPVLPSRRRMAPPRRAAAT